MDRIKTIEQALDLTGYGHYNVNLFMYFSCIVVSMTFEYFSTFYLLSPSASELNTSSSQQELIGQFPMIGFMMFGMKWGTVADTRGRKKILQITLAATAICGTCAAISPHWIVLLILKFISGASVSGTFTSSFALLTECTPMRRRSALVILTMSTFLVALGTMAVLSMSVLTLTFNVYFLGIYINPWRLLCLLCALPSVFCVFGVKYVFESPKHLLAVEKDYQALEVLKGMYILNNRVSAENYQVDALILNEDNVVTTHMNVFKSYWILMTTFMKNRGKYFAILINVFPTAFLCMYFYIEILPVVASAFTNANRETYLTVCDMVRGHQNTTTVGQGTDHLANRFSVLMTFAVGIALAGLNVIIYNVFKYVGRKKIIFGIQILVAVASLCINFSPVGALNAILYMFILFGIFNVGLLSTYAIDMFPSYSKATAIGITAAAGIGPTTLATSFVKKFLYSNCEVSFYITLAVACVGALLAFFLPSEKTVSGLKKLTKEPEREDEDINLMP